MQETNLSPRKKQPLTNNSYAKYAGMGFQMAAIIGLGTFAGMKLDQYFGLKKIPAFTVTLSLLAVFSAMYYFIKDFLKKK